MGESRSDRGQAIGKARARPLSGHVQLAEADRDRLPRPAPHPKLIPIPQQSPARAERIDLEGPAPEPVEGLDLPRQAAGPLEGRIEAAAEPEARLEDIEQAKRSDPGLAVDVVPTRKRAGPGDTVEGRVEGEVHGGQDRWEFLPYRGTVLSDAVDKSGRNAC